MTILKKETKDNNRVELTIRVEEPEWQKALDDAYQANRDLYPVDGCAPGKATRRALEQAYAPDVFYQEAVNETFPRALVEAFGQEEILVAGAPELRIVDIGPEGFTFAALAELYPEVKLGKYKGLAAPMPQAELSNDDVDKAESEWLQAHLVEEERDRAAMGDEVTLDFDGSVDGVPFDGGKAEGYTLTLGSGAFIPGFEDQIVGHMPGETFDVNVTFPDDYQATNLAGKDAVFATTLNYINEDVTPDLTDDWVSSNLAESMGMNNVAELKTFVSNSLLFNQEANELYGQLYDAAEVNTDTLPEDVQQYFTNTVLYQPYLYAQMRGVSLETMLSQAGYSSVDEYLENSESSKQSMIKQILIMQALAEKNNIVCDTDILNAEFSRYFGSTDMTSYVNAYGENYVKTNILHDIVMQNQIDNVA